MFGYVNTGGVGVEGVVGRIMRLWCWLAGWTGVERYSNLGVSGSVE